NIPNLTVVDKVNGRKADAVNVGIGFARHPLMCVIDADSIIEADGMLRATEPFLNDDGSLVAVGGHIRLTNGCDVGKGQVHSVGMPDGWIPRFQILEYLRAFIVSRVAASRWGMLMLISGAFGVFKRDAVIEAGGYRHDTVGEDLELVVRLQREAYERGRRVRVGYVPDALCWTEAPITFAGLRNQRTRWQQGALETLERHKIMLFNPTYGRIGMLAMPLMLIEDVLGPTAELTGYIMMPTFYFIGISPLSVLVAFYALSLLFGTLLSLCTLAHEELQYRAAHRVKDIAILVMCSLLENFGYRQSCAWFRLRGIYKRVRGNTTWAAVPRVGFAKKAGAR
ncbi:MAG: glycosyltransferase family 2 protein, partial [Alphaproteobacteria bacterium]|nr:glycosyltransferase family 2 protein [Alphaproteobacteria bacterium]